MFIQFFLPSDSLHWTRVASDTLFRSPFLELKHIEKLDVKTGSPLRKDIPLASGQRVNADYYFEGGASGYEPQERGYMAGRGEDDGERAVIGAGHGISIDLTRESSLTCV